MKKTILLLIAISCSIFAVAQKSNNFKAKFPDGTPAEFAILADATDEVALVDAKNSGKARMEIPSTINYKNKNYQITVLAKYSLKDCDANLRELIIPSTVREIETSLFIQTSTASAVGTAVLKYYTLGLAGKRKRKSNLHDIVLTNLQIGKGVKTIAEDAFMTYCNVFNKEKTSESLKAHFSELPDYIRPENAEHYGLTEIYVKEFWDKKGGYINTSSGNSGNSIDYSPNPSPIITSRSDIDIDIPKNPETNKKTFALIFANEEYQRESRVDFALNDGRVFKTYCRQVLGLPEKNVHYVENATLNTFIFELDWVKNVCDAFDGTADVIIYYAGHGIPDETNGKAYLLPIDGSGKNTRTCLSLDDFYSTVAAMKARHVTIFLDACFSGSQRNGAMQTAARGVAIKAKPSTVTQGKMVVFSAATGDETAYSYKEKGHGLFTYFLLKKLKESKGNTTLGELRDYINSNVRQHSIVENGKSQTPTVTQSKLLQQSWRELKLK